MNEIRAMASSRTAHTNGRHSARDQASPFAIRPARTDDIDQLTRIETAAFRSYYRPHRYSARDFVTYLGRHNTVAFVAAADKQLIGYVLGEVPVAGHPFTARVDSIAVLPAWRRREVGDRLLSRFLQVAKRRGCRRAFLEVAVRNLGARALFAGHHFRSYRRLPGYYADKADAVRLKAALV